jgi:branched-chain amino acid transport system substrate-binding protein
MKLSRLGVIGAGVVFVVAACTGGASTAPSEGASAAPSSGASAAPSAGGTDKGAVVIGIDLPLQGSDLAGSQPVVNGALLAVKEAGGAAGGFAVSIPQYAIYDDSRDGSFNPEQGAQNAQAIIARPEVIGMVGPLNSSVGKAQIPITNEAGLLQCSPANTNPDLTKPPAALEVRTAFPDRINYVRVATTDDLQGPAVAQFTYTNLGLKTVYILDDTTTFGIGVANTYEEEFKKLGGTVVKRDGVPKETTDYTSVLTAAKALNPEAVFFGGVTSTGGARIRNAAVQVGLNVPYLGTDGIYDGPADRKDSYLNIAQANGPGSYSSLAGLTNIPNKDAFEAAYTAEYGEAPTGYAAFGHACAAVVLDALNRAGANFTDASDMAGLREAVRAAGVDTTHTYDLVIGQVTFDENGDTSQKIVSVFSVKDDGSDWSFEEEVSPAS